MKLTKNKISIRHFLFVLAITIILISCNQNRQEIQETDNKTQLTNSSIVSKEIPIWTKKIPDFELIKGTETYNDGMINNVSTPTIKIYSPKENNTGVAILVFPGGGYNKLAIDLEGSEICEWLASIGVTGVLLKY